MSTVQLATPLTGAASGFPEYTPAQQRAFNLAVQRITKVYESFGFTPLETAAVEKIDTLTSKGIAAKEVYGLRRLAEDASETDSASSAGKLALRFDLTVPTARYVAANQGALVFPFRRYQVQPVWRGERAQAGRYRQFYQFDIDTIGDGTLPLAADAEILAAGYVALKALNVGRFTLRVNNRKLLQGLLEWAGYGGAHLQPALKIIDDADKVGWDEVSIQLKQLNQAGKYTQLPSYLQNTKSIVYDFDDALPLIREGIEELNFVISMARKIANISVDDPQISPDLSIARGLDYYTGTVVETRLEAAPGLGSIMSGGRYDNLTASLSKKQLPGVGISIGLSRLLAYLLTLPEYQLPATPARVVVACPDDAMLPALTACASQLRAAGVNVEQALGGQALGTQLKHAQARGLEWAVVAVNGTQFTLRHLPTRADEQVDLTTLAARLSA